MHQPFQEIEPQADLRSEARDQTLGSVYTLRLVMDLVDLFLAKPVEVLIRAAEVSSSADTPEMDNAGPS